MYKEKVVVTGFGPFNGHTVNASWEAVKLLNKQEIEDKHNVELVTLEVPVIYESVDQLVPELWKKHSPKLVIHVGVSGMAYCLTLETQALRTGYQNVDYLNKCPANQTCPVGEDLSLQTKLNVERICKEINTDCPFGTRAVPSACAGSYLCEYIYYTSLSMDRTRTLFVHVPDLHVYSSEQSARGLEYVLHLCLDQLEKAGAS